MAEDPGRPVYLDLFKYWLEDLRYRVCHGAWFRASSCPTNSAPTWSVFSDGRRPLVIGPLMAYEVLGTHILLLEDEGFLGVYASFGMGEGRAGSCTLLRRAHGGRLALSFRPSGSSA